MHVTATYACYRYVIMHVVHFRDFPVHRTLQGLACPLLAPLLVSCCSVEVINEYQNVNSCCVNTSGRYITLATKINVMDDGGRSSLPVFDVHGTASEVSQRWTRWLRSFEYMADGKAITDFARRRALLLHLAGEAVQDLFEDLLDPDVALPPGRRTNADNVYKQCKRILTHHFAAPPNTPYERHQFRQLFPNEGESTQQFSIRLRQKARLCGFDMGYIDDAIRDQLIATMRSSELRQKILAEGNLSLERTLTMARTWEEAHAQSSQMEPAAAVNAVAQSDARRMTCYSCGMVGHKAKTPSCPAKDKKCHNCGKSGHFAKCCRSKQSGKKNGQKPRSRQAHQVSQAASDPTESTESFSVGSVSQTTGSGSSANRALFVTVSVCGKPLSMEIDTGASVALVPQAVWQKTWSHVKLQKSDMVLDNYGGWDLPVVGEATVTVEYNQQSFKHQIVVVKGGKHALLGRNWLQHIKLDWKALFGNVNAVHQSTPPASLGSLAKEFPSVFAEGLGTVRDHQAKIRLKDDAKPKCCRPRPMPYALRESVDAELDRLEQEGIIKPVEEAEWASPIVVVRKKNGSVRICADFKVTINQHIESQQHPIPNPTDLLAQLAEGSVFTTLDLSQAYAQLPIDETSQKYCVITTHRGLYAYQRLPFGVASAPGIWQRTMDQLLRGIPGVVCFFDDVLVVAATVEEHDRRLRMVLKRLLEYGIRLRQEKCVLRASKVRYLGYNVTAEGLQTSEDKVSAIVNAPAPKDVTTLQAFLGLVNFYNRFVPNLSTVLHPLHKLLGKDASWNWSRECEEAFSKVKQLMVDAPVLVHYDMSKKLVLECDASPVGIGACLWQVSQDGSRRPVHYVSRSLASAEAHYSQIEREALAIVFAVKLLHSYLYGCRFTLRTDHRPLRWSVILSAYEYDMEHIRGRDNVTADCLSRLPLPLTAGQVNLISQAVRDNEFIGHAVLPISAADIAIASKSDPEIGRVFDYLKHGWPAQVDEALPGATLRASRHVTYEVCSSKLFLVAGNRP